MASLQEKDYKIVINNYGKNVLVFSDNVEEIPDGKFKGGDFDEIRFPKNLKRIGRSAFTGCINLREVDIPDSVEYIGPDCFYSCSRLEEIKISKNVSVIFPSTFAYCSFTNIDIPDSIISIGDKAFYNSAKNTIVTINLPSSVKVVGKGALANIPRVIVNTKPGNDTLFIKSGTNIEFRGGHVDKKFFKTASFNNKNSYELTSDGTLIINQGIELVEDFTVTNFRSNTAIKKIIFPDSVKYIMDHSFAGLSYFGFNIPKNLIYVGQGVFKMASRSENNKIVLPDSAAYVGTEAFEDGTMVEIPETCNFNYEINTSHNFITRKVKAQYSIFDVINSNKNRLKEIGYDFDKVSENINSIVKKDDKKIKQLEELLVTGLLTGAIDDNTIEVFTEFIKCGVSPYLYVKADNFNANATKYSLMHYLIIKEQTKLIIQLFYYGYMVETDNDKRILMAYASRMSNSNLLELFIALNFPVNSIDKEGNTPLIIAAKYGNYDNVKLLIENNASVSVRNNEDYSALDIAKINNRTDIVKLLEYETSLINRDEFVDENIDEANRDLLRLSKFLGTE